MENNNEIPIAEQPSAEQGEAAPIQVPQTEEATQQKNLQASAIVPPQLAHIAQDFDLKCAGPAPIQTKKISPVVKIYPMNDYVILETADGAKHPIDYITALDRADQVKQMMLKENTDKPKDERDKEYWLVYHIVKSAHQCSIYAKKPFSQRKVDKFLYDLDYCLKQISRNKK
jgi:hypothetical protein